MVDMVMLLEVFNKLTIFSCVRELESQEGLRVDAEGSAAAVAKKIQNYELEIASYK